MGILADWQIEALAIGGMIDPYCAGQISASDDTDEKIISYGLSSYGYDLRLSNEYRIFSNAHAGVIDPKYFNDEFLYDVIGDVCVVPPNGFALARSMEFFDIPRNIMTICLGKSTYARCGIIVGVTALEPEWKGHVTIEISNTTPLPVRVYSYEGIVQVLFLEGSGTCRKSYLDKDGKYQGQTGVTLAK
jgi:dCTP deaminase